MSGSLLGRRHRSGHVDEQDDVAAFDLAAADAFGARANQHELVRRRPGQSPISVVSAIGWLSRGSS